MDPRKKPHIKIQPPFIRSDLSDRQITIKVSGNGIHSTIINSKVSSSQLPQPSHTSSHQRVDLTEFLTHKFGSFVAVCSVLFFEGGWIQD